MIVTMTADPTTPRARLWPLALALGLGACGHAPVIEFNTLAACIETDEGCAEPLDTPLGRELLVEDGLQACKQRSRESCEFVGRRLLELGQAERAYRPLEWACSANVDSACGLLITSLLSDHRWLLECASRAETEPGKAITLPLVFESNGPRRPASVRLDEGFAGSAKLRRCLEQALAHTDFPAIDRYWPGAVQFDYRLTLDPAELWAALTRLDPWIDSRAIVETRLAGPPPSCPGSEPCAIVLPRAVYAPKIGEAELITLGSSIDERSIHFSIEHCITADGKIDRFTARGRGSQRAVIDALAERVPIWRFKPLLIDGQAQPWCPSTRVDVDFRWRARPR